MLIYEFGSHKYFTYLPDSSFIKSSQSIGYDSGHWIYSTPGFGNVAPFLSVVAHVKVRFMSTLFFLFLYRLFTLSSMADRRLELTFCNGSFASL